MSKPRVILADDHTMLVEAFAKLLEPECEIVEPGGRWHRLSSTPRRD